MRSFRQSRISNLGEIGVCQCKRTIMYAATLLRNHSPCIHYWCWPVGRYRSRAQVCLHFAACEIAFGARAKESEIGLPCMVSSMWKHAQTVNGSGNHPESAAGGSGNHFVGSSSGSHPSPESNKYDIFINHRGPDTKGIFVSHLEEELKRENISPFVDKSLREGEHSFKEIKAAIRTAPVQLAIFSPNYADSSYCLDELVGMLERVEKHSDSVTFLPIFFNVEPSDLRKTELFGYPFYRAFQYHKKNKRYTDESISNWKKALNDAAEFKGFELKFGGDSNELKHKIVRRVKQILEPSQSNSDVSLPTDPDISPVADPDEPVEAPPENNETITFSPSDRPLRVLVLGNPDSVEDVVSRICGAGRRQTQVEDYAGLTESRSSSPPMCLYYSKTKGGDRNDFTNIFKAFVDKRNLRWHGKQVVTECLAVIHGRRLSGDLLPGSASRLHMVWYVCQKNSDLPDIFLWKEIMASLSGIPLQIVITAAPEAATLDPEYRNIFARRARLYPKAQKPVEYQELIVKFDCRLRQDRNLIEDLWRKCWEAKTRGEIRNVAKVIREVRKELGGTGISISQGVGSAAIPPETSLLLGGQFLLRDFFCKYWEVPDLTSIYGVLKELTTFIELKTFIEQTPVRTYRYNIQPGQLVKFCLQVAAIILYNIRDDDGNPRYVCDWPNSTSEPSFQSLKHGIEGCYTRYFKLDVHTYDKMKFNDIQAFLQSLFERQDFDSELLEGQQRACCSCLSL